MFGAVGPLSGTGVSLGRMGWSLFNCNKPLPTVVWGIGALPDPWRAAAFQRLHPPPGPVTFRSDRSP